MINTLPKIDLISVPPDQWSAPKYKRDRGPVVTPGWQGIPSKSNHADGGQIVTEQVLDASAVAQVDRVFTGFYGATARLNVVLGAQVANLGPSITEGAATLIGIRKASGIESMSLALVRQGADLVLREAFSPRIDFPYVERQPGQAGWRPKVPEWVRLQLRRFHESSRPHDGSLSFVDRIKFLTPSLRAIIVGSELIENAQPAVPMQRSA
jgi:hypothetical protein